MPSPYIISYAVLHPFMPAMLSVCRIMTEQSGSGVCEVVTRRTRLAGSDESDWAAATTGRRPQDEDERAKQPSWCLADEQRAEGSAPSASWMHLSVDGLIGG